MVAKILGIGLWTMLSLASIAQPSNDECATPILIEQGCSSVGAYTNINATPSSFPASSCFTNNSHDVWFSFTAVATNIHITVTGQAVQGGGGTLNNPEIALYSDNCGGNLNEIGCTNSTDNQAIGLFDDGLTIGQDYLIRVEGEGNGTGTFQLCLNNFNPPEEPEGDCPTAAVLCDKSPFVIQNMVGTGNNSNEAIGTCLDIGGNSETNSTWFVWTAATSGTLTFILTPLNPTDDIDFVIYELPNGMNDCNAKTPLLCMASGESISNYPTPCHGATGLSTSATDAIEIQGCDPSDDNFIQPLNMTAGNSYGLLINNLSSVGDGFSIEFGGTGTFQGPEANILAVPPSPICQGETVSFSDAAFPLSPVVNWSWNFGIDALPPTATGFGPHQVEYTTAGMKTVVMTVESQQGCLITKTLDIQVEKCCTPFGVNPVTQDLACANGNDGFINLMVNGDNSPFEYLWNTGSTSSNISNLTVGEYLVTITDLIGCDTSITIPIHAPLPFGIGVDLTKPTCGGGMDGAITLNISGATPPYLYNWNNTGFNTQNSLSNLPVSSQVVVIQDANLCEITQVIEVKELELELEPSLPFIQEPSCNGFTDGVLSIYISNGQAPYRYDFQDGNGFVTNNTLSNIPAGTYDIAVQDANGCQGNFSNIIVGEPFPFLLDIETVEIACYGERNGFATAMLSGGTPPYSYQWNTGSQNQIASNLSSGQYTLTATDTKGCSQTASTFINEPNPVEIANIEVQENECFGDETGSLLVAVLGGNPPFDYSVDGINFQADSFLTNLSAGEYEVTVRDTFGCELSQSVSLVDPAEIQVEAGANQLIPLGDSIDLQAITNTTEAHTYTWSPSEMLSCNDCPNPTAFPVKTTTYYIDIFTEKGCVATDSITITVNPKRPVYIPNAFTPNADGINDLFYVFGGSVVAQIRQLSIYNRWGGLVFQAQNTPPNAPKYGWDGKVNGKTLQPSVLVYVAEVEFVDGSVAQYSGNLTLLW